MDVNLLSKLLRELIIDNERVFISGMGYFTTETVPAFFSEDGKTIFPPSRRISFRNDERTSGDMIWKFYAKEYGIEEDTARVEVETFLKQLSLTFAERKAIDFPGFGRLLCTQDGEYIFINEKEDNIFSSAFGFEQVTLKPAANRNEADDAGKDTVAEIPEPVLPEPDIPQTPAVTETESPGKKRLPAWAIVLIILGSVIVLAAAFIILSRLGMFDALLYSPEELRIIENSI